MGKYATSISIKAEQIDRMVSLGYSNEELGAFLKACKEYVINGEVPSFTDRGLLSEFYSFVEWKSYQTKRAEDRAEQRKKKEEMSQLVATCRTTSPLEKEKEVEKEKEREKDNYIYRADKSANAPTRFQKPSLDEIKQYIRDMHYISSAESIFNYYESNGWKVGKNPMKDWKAAVRNWESNEKRGSYKKRISDISERSGEEIRSYMDDLNDPTA